MLADINTLRGVLLAIVGWVWPPFLQILTLFQRKNVIFHIRFQTWPLKSWPTWAETICHHYLDWNANILKFIFEFANYCFFLIHLELKRQMRSYTRSRSSLELYPIADQKRTKSITVFRSKRRKNHTLRGSTEIPIWFTSIRQSTPGKFTNL